MTVIIHFPKGDLQTLKRKAKYAWILVMLCSLFFTRAIAGNRDTLVLYNGQILIGETQGAYLGVISFDETDLGLLKVKLYKIRRLTITEKFKLQTVDKRILYGFFRPSEKDGRVNFIPDGGAEISFPIVEINSLISLEKNIVKRMRGNLSAGFSYNKSSNIGQINFSLGAEFATKLFDVQLSASELASIDSSRLSRDNENLQLFVAYELSPTWFISAIAQYQRNKELSLARRFSEMLGGGKKLVIRNNWQLLVLSGVSFSQEKSFSGIESGWLTEIPIMFRFNFYQFQHPNIQITSNQSVYFSLTQAGRVRYDGNTTFAWELVHYFWLNISPYNSFDSKPPSNTSSKFDYGIVLGISYRF